MNFYKHFIGDFQRDTSHLSLTQRGAYLALMHHYYATEVPLPIDHASLCRIAGAFTKPERDAVRVAMTFFNEVDSGLMHNRIEAEIHKVGEISTTNRTIALEREEQRRVLREAKTENEACTERVQSVERSEHEQSTPQTPDSKKYISPCGSVGKTDLPPCQIDEVLKLYHEALPEMPRVRLMSIRRHKAISNFWKFTLTSTKPDGSRRAMSSAEALHWIGEYFNRARDNDFLMGRVAKRPGHENWQCDLDYLMTDGGMKQVIEKTRETA